MPKTAILLGATGLVGSKLLPLLVESKEYEKIIIVSRKIIPVAGTKVQLIVDDMKDINKFSAYIKGDDLFCCLGTTIKKAGSKEAFKRIDYDLPYKIAVEARRNNVAAFYLISSAGANPKSVFNYLKVKGELEQAIQALNFDKFAALRPSLLLGQRNEFRLMESLSQKLFSTINPLFIGPLIQMRAIKAASVAKAMVTIANSEFNMTFVENRHLFKLAK